MTCCDRKKNVERETSNELYNTKIHNEKKKKTKHNEEKKNKSKLITSKSSSVSNLSAASAATETARQSGAWRMAWAQEAQKREANRQTDSEARNLQSANKNNRGSS